MKAKFLMLILPFLLAFTSGTDVRSTFHASMHTENGLKSFYESNKNASDAITMAYAGLGRAMMAEYATWPSTKLSYFNEGKDLIEKSIKQSQQQVESRYCRLMVQLNIPSILNYDGNIASDIDFFIAKMPSASMPLDWKKKLTTNVMNTSHISSSQKSRLSTLLNSLK
ncbi:MAG: hypothetical protein H6607_09765 [Flavobacteriales bacterium]|nr:hypothetical protein [Flavobacteriales bacterium]